MSVNMTSMEKLQLLTDCCSPLISGPVGRSDAERLASAFKVLGDPNRLYLLSLIGSSPDGEVCACDLVEPLDVSQPTVSHHLKVLYEAGLLEREKRGTWILYRIVPEQMAALREALSVESPVVV
jgi:ArsR family transcriptional regulator, arsenate/arsenite/antimonite-responsive transcriptional repressor